MPVNDLIGADVVRLGSAKITVSTAATTNFDFGDPADLNLDTLAGTTYEPGMRLLVIFDSSTAGTTNAISFSVQDAPDSAGSIGTPAAAVTDGTLTGGTGDQYAITGVRVQPGRPWIRCRATGVGTTDTHVVQVTVLGIPRTV